MRLATLAIKNINRHRSRTVLTALGIAVAIVLFTLMRTFVLMWTGAVDHAAKDRIATRHKVTFIMGLPKNYVDDIRATPGVENVTYMNWFGGKVANRPDEFFATIACDPETFLDVYDEILVDPAEAEAWKQNRRGALVGDKLAANMGWNVGDKVVLTGTIFPGEWDFIVEGIYSAERRSVDRASLWFHWNYLNDSPTVFPKDEVGWVTTRISDPKKSAAISKAIDDRFSERDVQTLTMSEKALQQSFMGMISAVITAVNIVSIAILIIILLILGNTIAMAVRERTVEYGCLRAIGFRAKHIAIFVVGESLTIGLLGGAVGLGLSQLFINLMLGPAIEENMGAIFPHFGIPPQLFALGLGLAAVLSVLAAALPAYRASQLRVADAIRMVD